MTHPSKICPECGTHYHAAATFCQVDGSALIEDHTPADLLVGTRLLDQFDVQEVIGAGGMGTVYRAHQASLGRDVAIKVLHRDLTKNADAVRRFQREARVATSLVHPNLVEVYLFGELPDGSLYLVMELLEGRTLAQALFEDGDFPLARALRIAHAASLGVGAAHKKGIVHRDVKPENIMLVHRDGDPDFVKVLDFGIARLLWDEQSHVTQSGVIFGTARYISPEGASGEPTDARSDVYSLAVLTYQLLTGAPPFDDPSPVALLMKHLRQKPPPLRPRSGGPIPDAVADVVMRGLNKYPDARQDTAQAFASALERAASSLDIAIKPQASRAPAKGPAATLLQTGPLIDAPAPLPSAAPARPNMATRRDGSAMTAIVHPEIQAQPVRSPQQGEAGERPQARAPHAHVRAGVHARQMMPAVDPTAVVLPVAASHPGAAYAPERGHPHTYSGDTMAQIPGLSRPRARAWMPVAAGFLVGLLVVGGYVAWSSGQDGAQQLEEARSLEARAREALAHGAIDSPPGDNVVELTRRLLEQDPAHAGARAIRREAALLLRERAANARAQNDIDAAREAYEQVLTLFPEDAAATEGLRLLARVEEVASAPPMEAGIHAEPETPTQRQSTRLVGVFGPGMRLPADVVPEFNIFRAGRRVGRISASPGVVSGTWVADHTFTQTGTHEVTLEFGVGAQRVMLRQELSVARARRGSSRGGSSSASSASGPVPTTVGATRPLGPPVGSSRPLGPPTTAPLPPPPGSSTPTTTPTPPPATMDDGIDWGVPATPAGMSEPPAPWTG